ncbi:hypothetical protein CPB86DRAFT_819102 [Serendipita vermifera]|nr:hypothetical protein CPB86DRAFT_819102 [Serendipita vermifera]
MSSPKPTTAKPERRKKRLGSGLLEFFGKKKSPQALVSSSSQSLHSSEAGSIQKHNHKPSITIEESTLPVVESVDAGASPYPHGTLHAPNARSRQSLTSHKSKGSFNSNIIFTQNERQWKMAYEIALEKLNGDERSQVDTDVISSCSVYSVLDAANKARAERDENKWRYTKKNGEVVILREKFDKIVEGFTKYAGFIGSTTQHQQPDATSLVWAAARSLIEIYLNHKESVELIEGALKTIAGSMANCEFYTSIFKDTLNKQFDHSETSDAWEKQLERALPEFYAAILVFSIKVKGYFVPSAIGRINKSMKPFSITFQPHLKEIERKEMTLRELANMATMEGVKDIRRKMDIVGEMRELFVQISDEKAMNWLSAISPITAYDFNKYRRLAGTCQWIFKTQKHQSWIDGSGTRDLWVVGIPVDILEWAHPDGLDFDTRDRSGITPFMRAAAVGEGDAVQVLLSKSGVDINRAMCIKKDCDGSCQPYRGTALIHAAESNRLEVVKILLAHPGIDVDLVTHGTTALGVAVREGFPKVIELLCRAGAKVSLKHGQVVGIPTR